MAFTGNYKCNVFQTGLATGLFNFGAGTTDVFKIALYTNAATLDSDTPSYTTTGEVTDTGYMAGGYTLTITTVPTVGGATGPSAVTYWSFANASWSGVITARGALIYKADGLSNPAICVLDFGANKTSASTFTVQFPAATNTSAIIRIA